MHVSRPLFLACAAAVLAASCGRDAPPPPVEYPAASGAPAAQVPGPPRLTPAESAAAVARQEAHADAMTREVRAKVGELDPPPPAAPHVETEASIYRSCVAQAQSVEDPLRSQLMEACERRRNGP